MAWAFSEVAEHTRRVDQMAKRFFERKKSQTNRMVAHGALAHKMSRAAYFIMRDNVPLIPRRCFPEFGGDGQLYFQLAITSRLIKTMRAETIGHGMELKIFWVVEMTNGVR